jgi:hypothetical protein
MDPINYIVSWSVVAPDDHEEDLIDQWAAFTSLGEARILYDDLLKMSDLYVANITAVIESTDYETHHRLTELSRA